MRYLNSIESQAILNANKIIEQLLDRKVVDDFLLIRYISMFRSKEDGELKYVVSLHELFDDRIEGIESIYDFSSFDPDLLDGAFYYFDGYEDALVFSKSLGALENKFMMSGYLQGEFLRQNW